MLRERLVSETEQYLLSVKHIHKDLKSNCLSDKGAIVGAGALKHLYDTVIYPYS